MSNKISIQSLDGVRVAIKAEIARHQSRAAELTRELEALDTAARVVARYIGRPAPQPVETAQPAKIQANAQVNGKRPGNIPEMIFVLAREGALHKPGDALREIRARWEPDVKSNNVGPTLWRLVKEGRIIKDESGYRLP